MEKDREEIKEYGTTRLDHNAKKHKIQLLTVIGEIEGHETVSGNAKATKYEHLLPKLAEVEDNEEIDGLLILLNTLGGDVEAGLSIAEMIASLSKPTVSLVLGGQSFHRRTHCCGGGLFFYCPQRDYYRASGPFLRDVYRSDAESQKYGEDTGSDHPIYCGTFPHFPKAPGRADVGQYPAGKRCRNASGRKRSCTGRNDRRSRRNPGSNEQIA